MFTACCDLMNVTDIEETLNFNFNDIEYQTVFNVDYVNSVSQIHVNET